MLLAFINPSGPTRAPQELAALESDALLNSALVTRRLPGNHQAGMLLQNGTRWLIVPDIGRF